MTTLSLSLHSSTHHRKRYNRQQSGGRAEGLTCARTRQLIMGTDPPEPVHAHVGCGSPAVRRTRPRSTPHHAQTWVRFLLHHHHTHKQARAASQLLGTSPGRPSSSIGLTMVPPTTLEQNWCWWNQLENANTILWTNYSECLNILFILRVCILT